MLLETIKRILDGIMNDPGTGVQIRLTELYDHARRDAAIAQAFPSPKQFNQFMRAHHQRGVLKQVIPNYTVDTSVHTHYEWYFHRQVAVVPAGPAAEAIESNNRNRDWKKTIITASGEHVRSHQERAIHDALYKVGHFVVQYEFPLHAFGSNKDVDFRILNNKDRKEYYWEHFGMTNSEFYKDRMTEKLKWYSDAGFKTLDQGGNLIYTYYTGENAFHRSIQQVIAAIR